MEKNYKYEIQGKLFRQDRIIMEQYYKLWDILGEFDLDATKKTLMEIIKPLIKKKLPELMAIIFYGQKGINDVNWDKVHYEIIDEVIDDFFVLNPRLKNRVIDIYKFLALQGLGMITKLQSDIVTK